MAKEKSSGEVKIPDALQALLNKAKAQELPPAQQVAGQAEDEEPNFTPEESSLSPLLGDENPDDFLPPEQISNLAPFSTAKPVLPEGTTTAIPAAEPKKLDAADIPHNKLDNKEPTLGEEMNLKTFEEAKAERDRKRDEELGLAQPALETPEEEPEPEFEDTNSKPEQPEKFASHRPKEAEEIKNLVAQHDPEEGDPTTISELVEQLEEARRVNQALRQDIQAAVEANGGKIPQEFWGMKQKLDEAIRERDAAKAQAEKIKKQPAPQPLPTWEGKDVRILFPCMKTTNPVTMFTLMALALDFGSSRIGIEMECGDSMIYHARNILADRFMAIPEMPTWSFWVDDDMILPIGRPKIIRQYTGVAPDQIPDSVLSIHVLSRLMETANKSGAKIVAGTYFGRRRKSTVMFDSGMKDPNIYRLAKTASGQVVDTDWSATGCLLVHRDVYLGIQKKFPERGPQQAHKWWDYFKPTDDGRGEDVGFGLAAKAAGFKTVVDTAVQCLHVGYMAYGMHNTDNAVAPESPNRILEI